MNDLYRFYDIDNQLLYVGISLHAAQRASQHRGDKSWWPDVDRMVVDHLDVDREEAHRIEREVIRDEKPIHNVTHNARVQTVVTIAPRIVWPCEICCLPIDDGAGYLEMPTTEQRRFDAELAEWNKQYPNGSTKANGIMDLTALFDMPKDCHWWSIHRTCDPDPDGGGYWFDVARARTHRDLLKWTIHLMEKRWFDDTDWANLIHKAIAA